MATSAVAEAYPKTVILPDEEDRLLTFGVMITPEELRSMVRGVATGIQAEARSRNMHPRLVGVLHGAVAFMNALSAELGELEVPHTTDTIHVTRYGSSMHGGNITLHKDLDTPDVTGQWLILVEDIKEGGQTLQYAKHMLEQKNPVDVQIAALLDKPQCNQVPGLKADYLGRSIGSEFVVGFGLDLNGLGRDLPAIYAEQPDKAAG